MSEPSGLNRRHFLKLSAAAAMAAPAASAWGAIPAAEGAAPTRRLSFVHTHIDESLSVTYFRRGSYVADGLRDEPYEIISGYRSPQTNTMLHNRSSGVATRSLHMDGKAIDVRLSGFSCKKLRDLALSLRRGGVGYYASSNFVHLDTGRVRSW